MKKLIMSPGPTEIDRSVLLAMTKQGTNPDLDPSFFDYYHCVAKKYSQFVNASKGMSLFLTGEAILGLEAAAISFVEPGDKVLCIANGFFGEGFKRFIEMAGGEPIMLTSSWQRGVQPEEVTALLAAHSDIKIATMVHCETPTGVTNQLAPICQMLKQRDILTIVDSVSAIGGEYIHFDNDGIDVLLGGSQKCLSAPPGLTMITLSEHAQTYLKKRKSPINSYVTNLKLWLDWYDLKRFPYTQAQQNIYGLEAALDNVMREDFVKKHRQYAEVVRETLIVNGLKLYAQADHSNTVTAVYLPEGVPYQAMFDELLHGHKIVIGGGLADLKGKIFRIGHMGENNRAEKMIKMFTAIDAVMYQFGQNDIFLADSFRYYVKAEKIEWE